MKTIECKYEVGEVVYVATSNGAYKKVIDAIKVDNDGIDYGFYRRGLYLIIAGGYIWLSEDDLFPTKKEALVKVKQLQEEREKRLEENKKTDIQELAEKIKKDQERLERMKADEY